MLRICKGIILIIILLFLIGCDEEPEWEIMNGEEFNNIYQFMEEYMDSWHISLQMQNYSIMEQFFVPNTHVYHMQRRQHQQFSAERRVERLLFSENEKLEVNQFGERRWIWTEVMEIQRGTSVVEEARDRIYYLSPSGEDYKITTIERSN
ncbi:hypothetical protein QA612_08570 [Evansella sp. AB-P1]|uniref:hypothetical protein n=1 Tax=Evansella sp. AB-P1 TaxID=3037653 RepID=UPI00241E8F4C|nr:hypothetical protein [Evansella sp. AB-P1]MDG5787547.1 hypothetical protein [Evansella sp. AB-P1]